MTTWIAQHFVRPWILLALPLLFGVTVALGRMLRSRPRRTLLALGVRALVLAALLIALARPRFVERVDRLAVQFLLDVSESVPVAQREEALAWIERKLSEVPPGDLGSVVVFADRPSLEIPLAERAHQSGDEARRVHLAGLESRLRLSSTDLVGALEFAERTFPDDAAKRIVLLSDGQQTGPGDVLATLRGLRGSSVVVDVRPVRYRHEEDVWVDELHVPSRGHLGEPLPLRAVVSAAVATPAEVRLTANGVPLGAPLSVQLEAGPNVLAFTHEPGEPGFVTFECHVRAERDGNANNDVGRASTQIGGTPSVLVVTAVEGEDHLSEALQEVGFTVRAGPPTALPEHPAGFVDVETVVLNDVAAHTLTAAQVTALADAVRELAVGLVVVGGPHAFGPGGYRGSPLEALLPVDLDTTNRKAMPKGALVIVLHSIEFDSGNTWANRICRAALTSLSPQDEVGIVYYDSVTGERWLFPLAPLGDGSRQRELIAGVYPGDMPDFATAFSLASEGLLASNAAVKHVVVISDGDPQDPLPGTLQELVADRVTISTICIDPHAPNDPGVQRMQRLAALSGGRSYVLDSRTTGLGNVPRLMLKEATTLRRSEILEKDFTPLVVLSRAAVLRGMDGFPLLHGYLVTSAKGDAETYLIADEDEGDPLLAAWYAGLGRVMAFTSDATSRWARDWLAWEGFQPFWAQVVRSTVARSPGNVLPVTVEIDDADARIVLVATTPEGAPDTSLAVTGKVLGREGSAREVVLEQVEPGRYEARVPELDPGHYLVQCRYAAHDDDARSGRSNAVFSIGYAAEHRSMQENDAVLRSAAELTSGRMLTADDDVFRHDVLGVRSMEECWTWFVVLAACLLVLDLVVRRFDVSLTRWWRRVRPVERGTVVTLSTASTPQAQAATFAEGSREPVTPDEPTSRRTKDKEGEVTSPSTLDALQEARKRAEDRRRWQP